MAADVHLVDTIRRLEAELVSAAVWQSREELEVRMTADFVEVGSSGTIDREQLIAIVFGTDLGDWHAEEFRVRELTPHCGPCDLPNSH
jgi:hypothetical protein